MTNKKRLAATVLAALVFFVLMTSLFVITHEADHDCIGEGCPVCSVITVCENTLKTLGDVPIAVSVVFSFFCFAASVILLFCFTAYNETPVSLKVKLLN